MLRFLVFLGCVFASIQPAAADEFFAVTPSGATEVLFGEPVEKAVSLLSNRCIDSQMTVITSTPRELVCEAPLNFGQSLLGQMLLGNSYSTPPRRFYRFNLAEINGVARAQASGWMEVQMAFGQVRRTDFAGPEFHNALINFMLAAGGQLPLGTTFPNHVLMGFEGASVKRGKLQGIEVTRVAPETPSASAGLQTGDVVLKIAGKTTKSDNDFLDAAAKATRTATYPVEVDRGGKRMVLTLSRAFRPSITEPVKPYVAAVAEERPAEPAMSIADEIGKLAKLKEQGLLTEAEFEAQKKKLLGL